MKLFGQKPRTRQPQTVVRLNRGNPLAKKLRYASALGPNLIDVATDNIGVASGGPESIPWARGLVRNFVAASSQYIALPTTNMVSGYPLTVACRINVTTSASGHVLYSLNGTNYSAIAGFIAAGAALTQNTGSGPTGVGKVVPYDCYLVCVHRAGSWDAYADGELAAPFNQGSNWGEPAAGNHHIGARVNGASPRYLQGTVSDFLVFEGELSAAEAKSLSANPDQIYLPSGRNTYIAPSSTPTTPALTGQAVTVAAGSLTPVMSAVLAGNAAVAAQGTLSPTSLLPLTGQAAAIEQGSVAPVITVALTGLGTTAAIGTLTVANQDITLALIGLGTSAAQGTLAPDLSAPITGQATVTALGTATPGIGTELTGQTTTAAIGSVAPQITVGLTGVATVVDLGTVVVPGDVTATLTGSEVITGLGTLTPVITPDQQPGKSHTDLTIRQMLVDYYTVAFAKKLDQPPVTAEPAAKQKLSRPSAKIQKVLQAAKTEVPSVRAARVAEAAELAASRVAPDILADLTQSALKFNTLVLDFQAFEREQQRRRERDDADLLLLASVL